METQSVDTDYGKEENKAWVRRETFLPGHLVPRPSWQTEWSEWLLGSCSCPRLMEVENVLWKESSLRDGGS